MAAKSDNTNSNFPLAGSASDGWSTEEEATATCYCGAVQLAFVSAPQHGQAKAFHLEICP